MFNIILAVLNLISWFVYLLYPNFVTQTLVGMSIGAMAGSVVAEEIIKTYES